jgi:hypothetical protein
LIIRRQAFNSIELDLRIFGIEILWGIQMTGVTGEKCFELAPHAWPLASMYVELMIKNQEGFREGCEDLARRRQYDSQIKLVSARREVPVETRSTRLPYY